MNNKTFSVLKMKVFILRVYKNFQNSLFGCFEQMKAQFQATLPLRFLSYT